MSAPAENGTPVIRLCDVTKVYGTEANPVPVLHGVGIEVLPGEFVTITGPSGSGKSTLLNILGCLDRPTAGSYELLGLDVSRADETTLSRVRNRQIGFVFQSFQLIPHLTVAENIELPLFYARVPRAARQRRTKELAASVGLADRMHHRPSELSGGECQRAAIARALANDPAMLLADEPTGNLDSKTSAAILALVDELHGNGNTIVMITHDNEIAEAAPRRIKIRDGRVEADSGRSGLVPPEAVPSHEVLT